MTILLTPDKKPFYGGTYFPPKDRWGRPGLKTILNSIADAWKNRKDEILRSSDSLTRAIKQQKDKNILYQAHSLQETAKHFKRSTSEIDKTINNAKGKLFDTRSKRPRAYLDDKILVDWNGLMISSLTFGSRVLKEPRYREAAENAALFVLKNLIREDGRLLHRWRQGESAISGTVEDYAFFIHGLIDLYEATFNPDYLKDAKRLAKDMLAFFWDETDGGFFFTADDAEKLLVRQKEIYDRAILSGNSVAALDLIRLGRLTMEKEFEEKAEALFKSFSNQISQMPNAYPQALIALDFALGPSKEIVIAEGEDIEKSLAMLRVLYEKFIPNKVVVLRPGGGKKLETLTELVPFTKNQYALEGKTTVYVCTNHICKVPTMSMSKLRELLEE